LGRGPGRPYWGVEGTAVAGIIAAHERGWGLVGVAPSAKILSVRVTLEFNDPLASDQAVSQRLPDAIAAGIRYAADHGARIIDLPLDPGTLGLTSTGDPAAAGGSPAERTAIADALGKGIVLVAPAGDDGQGPDIVNYPAAYTGVIAVGAIGRTGQLASFSSKRSYSSLTAPGVGLVVAAQPDGYGTISSTSTASGLVAGVAALVLAKFPSLTAAQVTQVLIESTAITPAAGLPPLPARSAAGGGYGTVDAIRALDVAAIIASASQPRQAAPSAAPRKPALSLVASPRRPAASSLAGSVLRDAVAAVCVLIVLLVVALLVVRSRRDRRRARRVVRPRQRSGAAGRKRTRGQHENRGPAATAASGTADDAMTPWRPQAARPGPPASAAWTSPAGWQGGGIGEIGPARDTLRRPVVAPVPKSPADYRTGRGAGRRAGDPGPPWEPAPEPERPIGPLPVASAGLPPPEPGRGIRVPRDMAPPPGATTDPSPPISFDLTTPPADFDLSTPAFGLTPPAFGVAPPPAEAAPPGADEAPPAAEETPLNAEVAPPAAEAVQPAAEAVPPAAQDAGALLTRASLGFAAAPVPADYAAPPTELAPEPAPETAAAADPSYIWDLAATDVFPAVTEAAVPQDDGPEADEG
jgi:Subtilase family